MAAIGASTSGDASGSVGPRIDTRAHAGQTARQGENGGSVASAGDARGETTGNPASGSSPSPPQLHRARLRQLREAHALAVLDARRLTSSSASPLTRVLPVRLSADDPGLRPPERSSRAGGGGAPLRAAKAVWVVVGAASSDTRAVCGVLGLRGRDARAQLEAAQYAGTVLLYPPRHHDDLAKSGRTHFLAAMAILAGRLHERCDMSSTMVLITDDPALDSVASHVRACGRSALRVPLRGASQQACDAVQAAMAGTPLCSGAMSPVYEAVASSDGAGSAGSGDSTAGSGGKARRDRGRGRSRDDRGARGRVTVDAGEATPPGGSSVGHMSELARTGDVEGFVSALLSRVDEGSRVVRLGRGELDLPDDASAAELGVEGGGLAGASGPSKLALALSTLFGTAKPAPHAFVLSCLQRLRDVAAPLLSTPSRSKLDESQDAHAGRTVDPAASAGAAGDGASSDASDSLGVMHAVCLAVVAAMATLEEPMPAESRAQSVLMCQSVASPHRPVEPSTARVLASAEGLETLRRRCSGVPWAVALATLLSQQDPLTHLPTGQQHNLANDETVALTPPRPTPRAPRQLPPPLPLGSVHADEASPSPRLSGPTAYGPDGTDVMGDAMEPGSMSWSGIALLVLLLALVVAVASVANPALRARHGTFAFTPIRPGSAGSGDGGVTFGGSADALGVRHAWVGGTHPAVWADDHCDTGSCACPTCV